MRATRASSGQSFGRDLDSSFPPAINFNRLEIDVEPGFRRQKRLAENSGKGREKFRGTRRALFFGYTSHQDVGGQSNDITRRFTSRHKLSVKEVELMSRCHVERMLSMHLGIVQQRRRRGRSRWSPAQDLGIPFEQRIHGLNHLAGNTTDHAQLSDMGLCTLVVGTLYLDQSLEEPSPFVILQPASLGNHQKHHLRREKSFRERRCPFTVANAPRLANSRFPRSIGRRSAIFLSRSSHVEKGDFRLLRLTVHMSKCTACSGPLSSGLVHSLL